MSIRQAFRAKFRQEKSEVEKEEVVPTGSFAYQVFNDDELSLSQEDITHTFGEAVLADKDSEPDAFRLQYESHLHHLQEQLMVTMLENQQLLAEIKQLKEREEKMKQQQQSEKTSQASKEDKEKLRLIPEKSQEKENDSKEGISSTSTKSPRLRRFAKKDKHSTQEKSKAGDAVESTSQQPLLPLDKDEADEKDSLLETPTESQPQSPPTHKGWKCNILHWLHGWFYEVLEDFTETYTEEDESKDVDEGDPLTVRKLKENILRFGNATRPISNMVDGVMALLRWKSPGTTLLAFSVYMYTVYYGWFLPLVLFLANCQLLLNFIRYRWFLGLYPVRRADQEETDKDLGVSDKFQLVLHVARKAQNQLGSIADCCEKIKNLFLWQQPDVTLRLLLSLAGAFLASCIFPANRLFTALGMYFGLKLFLVDYIYYRFPRVQQKYDSTSRMWHSLPTDAELEKRQSRAEIDKHVLNQSNHGGCPASTSGENQSFCELFNLPPMETPIHSWHSGKRCTLINRDKSLTSAFKNGRLYLTNSFLCFERSKHSNAKNLVLPLKNITKVEKAKLYPWIPGGGMAIEISMDKPEKTYIFGTMLCRDDAYESIMEAGRKAGLPWAMPPESEDISTQRKTT